MWSVGNHFDDGTQPLRISLLVFGSFRLPGQVPDVKEVKTLQEQATLSEDRARQYLHQYYDAVVRVGVCTEVA